MTTADIPLCSINFLEGGFSNCSCDNLWMTQDMPLHLLFGACPSAACVPFEASLSILETAEVFRKGES